MKTYMSKPAQIKRGWYLIDAKEKILGRISSRIANIISGKHKAIYTPGLDTGDYIVVINADKIKVTGNKLQDKIYTRYSRYPSGLKKISLKKMLEEKPAQVLRHAVTGMLPKSSLGRAMLKKLKIYSGQNHPYLTQEIEEIKL